MPRFAGNRPLLVIALLVSACLAMQRPALSEETGTDPFILGVQTHFAQGWDIDGLRLLPGLGAIEIRDEVGWREIEEEPGIYDMSAFSGYLDAVRGAGAVPLVLFIGTNDNYDGGTTPYTEEGRNAFAQYVTAVIDSYPDLIHRIEIGNEYNSDGVTGPYREKSGHYMGLLIKDVVPVVKAAHPDTEILCTGAHSVATGYFRKVFETGALDYCDAVSFHPYRDEPEHVDSEIERLKALMREFGGEKPLYATEFGKWFEDPEDAPDFMLKMVSLMGSAGVSGAYWYALFNEEWWPNMGLLKSNEEEMPAARAFRFLQETLLPLGRPVSKGERGEDHLYEFGNKGRAFVAWGAAPARLVVEGEARFFDSSGNPIDPVPDLSAQPVVIMGNGVRVQIERERPVYSAFYGYGSAPWSYLAMQPGGKEQPFQVMDWNWNPYLGAPYHNPMKVTPTAVEAALFDSRPYHTVERFTAPQTGEYEIRGRWFRDKEQDSDGADIYVALNGRTLATGVVADAPFEWIAAPLSLKAGDQVDFAVGPRAKAGGDWVRRDITIVGP